MDEHGNRRRDQLEELDRESIVGRRVKVTDRNAAVDFAQVLKELSDVDFPDAEQIQLVQDNQHAYTGLTLRRLSRR